MVINEHLQKLIQQLENSYEEKLEQSKDVSYSAKTETEREVAYYNSEYTGEYTGQLNWRMFQNIVNQFIDVELTATHIKLKKIETIAEDEDYVYSLILSKERQEEFDRIKFANIIRQFQKQKKLHGTAFIKVLDREDEYIQVLDGALVQYDPTDLTTSRFKEPFLISVLELQKKKDVWDESDIDSILRWAYDNDKTHIEGYEVFGEFRESDVDPYEGDEDIINNYRLVVLEADEVYVADSYVLDEPKINVFWRERRMGNMNGKGISIIKEAEKEQIAINEAVVSRQENEAILGKVGVRTNLKDMPGILQIENGFVVNADDEEYFDPITFDAPQVNFQNTIDAFFANAQRKQSTFAGNTGEEVKSGSTFRGQALQQAQSSSYFNYLYGIDADDVVWIIENIIDPMIIKRINKEHTLNASYSKKEIEIIDSYVITREYNNLMVDMFEEAVNDEKLSKSVLTLDKVDEKIAELQEKQQKKGMRRSVFVPKGFFTLEDIQKKIRTVISSEQDDTQERIDELLGTMERMDPGDPSRVAMQQEIMELSGVSPVTFTTQSASGSAKAAPTDKGATQDVAEVMPESTQ